MFKTITIFPESGQFYKGNLCGQGASPGTTEPTSIHGMEKEHDNV